MRRQFEHADWFARLRHVGCGRRSHEVDGDAGTDKLFGRNGNVEVNLAHGTGKLGKRNATFGGIDKVQCGDNLSTLIGSQGFDTIQSANDGDSVILSDITLDQIISADVSADAVTINFVDGG